MDQQGPELYVGHFLLLLRLLGLFCVFNGGVLLEVPPTKDLHA